MYLKNSSIKLKLKILFQKVFFVKNGWHDIGKSNFTNLKILRVATYKICYLIKFTFSPKTNFFNIKFVIPFLQFKISKK